MGSCSSDGHEKTGTATEGFDVDLYPSELELDAWHEEARRASPSYGAVLGRGR